jgi:transcriptional regulator with XRE-family HTH domain
MKGVIEGFPDRLRTLRLGMELHQNQLAKALQVTPQYICDLESGRRLPSVKLVNRICEWIGCGPFGVRLWHKAGARAHGWKV